MSAATKRAALYTRVSTDDQTTALQRDEGLRLIAARGWQLAPVFDDIAVSGCKNRRPGLDAMLAAARKRRFDVLVVWRADRLFRSVRHMVATLAEFAALGVDFVRSPRPSTRRLRPGVSCSTSSPRSRSSSATS
jgi:DNA invertase Pin-like site-specific DNA recombinase